MSKAGVKHVMLSYAWDGDRSKVEQIAERFSAAGIPVWMDTKNGLEANLIDG